VNSEYFLVLVVITNCAELSFSVISDFVFGAHIGWIESNIKALSLHQRKQAFNKRVFCYLFSSYISWLQFQ